MNHFFSKSVAAIFLGLFLIGLFSFTPHSDFASYGTSLIHKVFALSALIDPDEGEPEPDPAPPATAINTYSHARFGINFNSGGGYIGQDNPSTDNPRYTFPQGQTQVTGNVVNDHNGKLFINSCNSFVPWLQVSCPVGQKVRGPKTPNGVQTAQFTLSLVNPPTSCPTGGCITQVQIAATTGGQTKFKWSPSCQGAAVGGLSTNRVCDAGVGSDPLQTETQKFVTITYVPSVAPAGPLTCQTTTPAPYSLNQAITFSAAGGDPTDVYHWTTPGASDAVPAAMHGTTPTFTTRFEGPQGGSRTMTVTRGSETCSRTITLTSPTQPDFTLSIAPTSPTVSQGQSTSFTITAVASGGFTGNITFDTPTLPTGASLDGVSSPPSISGGSGTSRFNLKTDCTIAPGSHPIIFTGRSGTLVKTVQATLNVAASSSCNTPPPPASTPLSCSPATQSVQINQRANFTASGGSGTYSWTAAPDGTPSSAGNVSSFSASFSTVGSKTVTVRRGNESAVCAVTVTATPSFSCSVAWNDSICSGGTCGIANFTINNLAAGKMCNFSCNPLSSCPAQSYTQSGSASYGPFQSGNSISFQCGLASGGVQICSDHPPFSGSSCTAPQSNPYFTCNNNACVRVNGCGASTGGCTAVGQQCGTPTAISCSLSVAPSSNPANGTVSYTVSNSSLDTRCNFGCNPSNPNSICSATITPGAGTVNGSRTYTGVTSQTNLSLQCQKGTAAPVTCAGSSAVIGSSGGAATCSFTSVTPNPITAGPGNKALLTWSSSASAVSCRATRGPWENQTFAGGGVGSGYSTAITSVPVSGSHIFGLRCTNAAGQEGAECTTTLQVVPASSSNTTTTVVLSCQS
jgi:hypothetical protein